MRRELVSYGSVISNLADSLPETTGWDFDRRKPSDRYGTVYHSAFLGPEGWSHGAASDVCRVVLEMMHHLLGKYMLCGYSIKPYKKA